jgi:hypothetical protein
MYHRILYLTLISLIISSCSPHNKNENYNAPQGYADSQLVGSWKITAFTSDTPYDWDGNGNAETNIYNNWDACEKDNLYIFAGDKTGSFKINCSVTKPGSWTIIDTKQLIFDVEGVGSQSEKFISMTSDQFKTTTIVMANGKNFTLTKIWSRQ